MVSIQYPTLPRGVDYNDIIGNATEGYKAGQDWRNEQDFKKALPGLVDSLYGDPQAPQAPQSLSGMSSMFGQPAQPNAVQRAPLAAPTDPATARVESAFAAQGQGRNGALPSVGEMTQYIAQAARQRGIDPNVAVRVARSEGLQPNTWQSNVTKGGQREPSYGPYQMLVGGGDTGFPSGLGNAFTEQTGLDVSDPSNWKKAVDFALDTASKQGWGQWYGAKAAGIGDMQGINGGGAVAPSQQALESLAVGGSTPMPQAPGVQVADASGRAGYQPPNPSSILPPRDVMLELFRNPVSRPLAISLAQSAQKLRAGANDPMAQVEYQTAVEKLRQLRSGRSGDVNYSLTPIYGKDAQGNTVLGTVGSDGSFRKIDTGGFTPSTGTGTVDLGTSIGTIDKRTGQIISTTPKNVYDEAFQKGEGGAAGKAQGEASASLPSDIQSANETVTQIDELLKNPGLDSIVGPADQYRPKWALGDSGRDALARYDQLKGKAFLQAYGMLKGGGQITEVEGQKAQDAMARMDRAQGEKEFRQALTDFRDAVQQGLSKLREKAGQDTAAQTGNRTSSGVQWSIEE